jgi:hypothetical protein
MGTDLKSAEKPSPAHKSGHSEKRDSVAELLSIVRYAYASGFRDGNVATRHTNKAQCYAESESRAIDYVQAREENERHPLALLVAELAKP